MEHNGISQAKTESFDEIDKLQKDAAKLDISDSDKLNESICLAIHYENSILFRADGQAYLLATLCIMRSSHKLMIPPNSAFLIVALESLITIL